MTVWIDGKVLDAGQATVSAVDHGLTVGDGVFETLRVQGGTPVALRRHLDRLDRSAEGLGLARPNREVVLRAIAEVVDGSTLADARLRITVTAGLGPLGSGRSQGTQTLIVAVQSLDPVPAVADVVVVPWVRNERSAVAGIKTTSYGENVVALAYAKARGASEAIFANTRGELCEGTGSNVFVVLDGELCTPPLHSGCLDGTARQIVIERGEIPVDQRDLPLSALVEAEEAFLTSSLRDVQPIATVDGVALPSAPGPVTKAVMTAFADLLARDLDP